MVSPPTRRLRGEKSPPSVAAREDLQVSPSFQSSQGINILQNDELGVDLQRREVIEEAVLERCRRQRALVVLELSELRGLQWGAIGQQRRI